MVKIKPTLIAPSVALLLSINLHAVDVFTIKNMNLKDALQKISKESNLSYIVDEKLIDGKYSPNIKNIKGIKKALDLILKNNDLEAIIENETIIIKKRPVSNLKSSFRNSSENSLGEIDIVSASRTNIDVNEVSANVTVIDKKQIQEQLTISNNASSVLANLIPSLQPGNYKLDGKKMRGRAPLVLVDGVPQVSFLRPTGRGTYPIDFNAVEKVEVIQGANALNGVGAAGGVINIVTKKPEGKDLYQSINLKTTIPTSGLDSETISYKTTYSLGGQNGDLDYYLSGSYEDQGLYLDGNGDALGVDPQGDLVDSKAYNILGKLGYWIDEDKNISLSANKYRIESDHNYVSVTGDKDAKKLSTSKKETPPGEAVFNDTINTALSYRDSNFYGLDLSTSFFYSKLEGIYGASKWRGYQDSSIAPLGTLYDQNGIQSEKYGNKIALNKTGLLDDKLNLTFGFDTMFDKTEQKLHLTNRTFVPEIDYRSYSPFLLGSYGLTDDLILHFGVRYENAEIKVDDYKTVAFKNNTAVEGGKKTINETLFNTGLVYNFNEKTNVYVNYSEGFALPDIGLTLRYIDTPGVSISSFKGLEPILTDNYEVGFRTNQDKFDFSASVYQSSSDFDSRLEAGNNNSYDLKRKKTQIRGLDLNLGVNLNDANRVEFLYSYLKGKTDDGQGGSLNKKIGPAEMSPNRLIIKYASKINEDLSTLVQANHLFSRTFEQENQKFSGYTLVDLSSTYKLDKNASVNLGISNLFDKQYVPYDAQSINWWGGEGYTAGRGRTITLGYTYNF